MESVNRDSFRSESGKICLQSLSDLSTSRKWESNMRKFCFPGKFFSPCHNSPSLTVRVVDVAGADLMAVGKKKKKGKEKENCVINNPLGGWRLDWDGQQYSHTQKKSFSLSLSKVWLKHVDN